MWKPAELPDDIAMADRVVVEFRPRHPFRRQPDAKLLVGQFLAVLQRRQEEFTTDLVDGAGTRVVESRL